MGISVRWDNMGVFLTWIRHCRSIRDAKDVTTCGVHWQHPRERKEGYGNDAEKGNRSYRRIDQAS